MIHKILSAKSDYTQFEQGLYKAYYTTSPWRRENYKLLDERLIPHYMYQDLMVIGAFDGDQLIGATSYIMNHSQKLIVEERGFCLPEDMDRNNIMEGLDFYSLVSGLASLRILKKNTDLAFSEAGKMGKNSVVGSCDEEIFPIYQRSHAVLLDQKVINGRNEIFFKMDF